MNLKELENELVERLTGDNRPWVFKWVMLTSVSVDYHYWCPRLGLKARVDDSGRGTYTFVWHKGKNLSYESLQSFDYKRVVTAMVSKEDVPTVSYSLWDV